MANFGSRFGKPHPHLYPVHNLYIYPLSANFTNFITKFGKVKSILIRVHFLKSDDATDLKSRSVAVCIIMITIFPFLVVLTVFFFCYTQFSHVCFRPSMEDPMDLISWTLFNSLLCLTTRDRAFMKR